MSEVGAEGAKVWSAKGHGDVEVVVKWCRGGGDGCGGGSGVSRQRVMSRCSSEGEGNDDDGGWWWRKGVR